MPVPTVQLTDDALVGIGASLVPAPLMAQLPQQVRLGRNSPPFRPHVPRLETYIRHLMTVPIPAAIDWYTKAAKSIAHMYLNDTYGDCVWASLMHRLGIWSANDTDSGGEVIATDQEVSSQYFSVCGPGDNGCYIPSVLDYAVKTGALAGGKRYKLLGYVAADWRSKELVQVGLALFGNACIGINLPSAWTSNAVWDVTNTRIVGGHDVAPCGYGASVLGTNADGVVISSWGRLYLITWPAFTSSKWLEEMYFMIPETLWTGIDERAPSGVDLATLKADLAMIGNGHVPPLPDPNPPPVPPVPPVPPPPPVPPVTHPSLDITLSGKIMGIIPVTMTGTGIPQTSHDPLGVNWPALMQAALSLFTHLLTRNWVALAADVLAILAALRQTAAVGVKAADARLSANWWQLVGDIGTLLSAIHNKDVVGAITAAKAVLADLGISL